MRIPIVSREKIEKIAGAPFGERVALVSISDYGDEGARLAHEPMYLCRVAFDDVDNDAIADEVGEAEGTTLGQAEDARLKAEERLHIISEAVARKIAEFYHAVSGKVDYFVCQCEHGQSRSAAVAAAIMEYRSGRGIDIFSSDKYYPNKVVFRRVLSALKEVK